MRLQHRRSRRAVIPALAWNVTKKSRKLPTVKGNKGEGEREGEGEGCQFLRKRVKYDSTKH
jgi:hypothetical protein